MFGQGYLVKKGVEYTGEALGMDKKDAKMLGRAAMFVTTIATLDMAGHAAGTLDDYLDDDHDDYDNEDWD